MSQKGSTKTLIGHLKPFIYIYIYLSLSLLSLSLSPKYIHTYCHLCQPGARCPTYFALSFLKFGFQDWNSKTWPNWKISTRNVFWLTLPYLRFFKWRLEDYPPPIVFGGVLICILFRCPCPCIVRFTFFLQLQSGISFALVAYFLMISLLHIAILLRQYDSGLATCYRSKCWRKWGQNEEKQRVTLSVTTFSHPTLQWGKSGWSWLTG